MDQRPERMLVVVAHPDDETFGCGSLLAHAATRGVETTVACATRGEAGAATPGRALDAAELAAVREEELRAAAALLGVARVDLLGWVDSGMEGEPAAGTLAGAEVHEVADAIATLVDEVQPTVVVTLDASDGHRDHAQIRDATLLAVELAEWSTARVYLHCLPQRLMLMWAEALRDGQPDSQHLEMGELGTPEDQITTIIETGELLELRERAIALHSSQTSPYEVMPPEVRRAFLTAERLRRVRPAWTGGATETELFESS